MAEPAPSPAAGLSLGSRLNITINAIHSLVGDMIGALLATETLQFGLNIKQIACPGIQRLAVGARLR